jgi:cytochrome c5
VSMIGCVSKALAVSGLVALMVPGFVMAEGDSTLLDNIRPVGRVNVDAPAAPPAPAVEAAPAPAAAAAPAVAEAPAAAPAAAPAPAAAADAGQAVYGRACIAVDALLQSAINGVPGTAMPPRGTCADCSDDDLKAAVQYMMSAAQ